MYQRLKKRRDFLLVKAGGFPIVTKSFIFVFKKRENCFLESRMGVVASKKSIGNSVKRNRAKRRLRSVFHLCFDSSLTGYDYVIIARHSLLNISFVLLKEDMKKAFNIIRKKEHG